MAGGCGNITLENLGSYRNTDASLQENTNTLQQSLFGKNEGTGALLSQAGVELPVSAPSIYVNQAGYMADGEKKAVFAGTSHGETFELINKADNMVVYTGEISKEAVDEISGCTLSTGDFTDFDEPGEYYIYTDIVGQSYPFSINEDANEELFFNILKNVSDANLKETPEGVCDVAFGMHIIMQGLKCNGELFERAYEELGDENQDKQLVTQLLYMADWLIQRQEDDGSLYGDYEATAAFCGIISMTSSRFGKYDTGVDSKYKAAVSKSWSWLQSKSCDTEKKKSARFYAASQLYSSEGSETYSAIVEEYLSAKKQDYYSDRFVFYGFLSYISAERSVDRDLCTYVMMDMVERTESICDGVSKDTFFAIGARSIEDNMSNMLHLCFINYLTPSREYTDIIENTIRYICGLNETGTCYMGEDGIWKDTEATKDRNFEWNGIMLFAMSDLINN